MTQEGINRLYQLSRKLDVPSDLLVDVIQEVARIEDDYEVVDDDALDQYRPWLREGQPWKSAQGYIGKIRSLPSSGWCFEGEHTIDPLKNAGGRPIGTVWDVLPTPVRTVRVQGGRVIAYNVFRAVWETTSPGLHTVYEDGEHNRPAWAANLPDQANS